METAQNTSKNLLFLIDTTGSMREWIKAIVLSLPLLTRGIALTQLFDKIGILSYTDYDQPVDKICTFSGWCESNTESDVNILQTFASKLKADGGGDSAEAAGPDHQHPGAEPNFRGQPARRHVKRCDPHVLSQ